MAKRNTSNVGGVHVDPRVTDPAAMAYAQSINQRKGPSPEKYNVPVGGGPNPPIPRLDMPHQDGMTMADQARAAAQPPPGSLDPASSIFPNAPIIGPEGQAPRAPALSRPPPNLLPQDILPEVAKQDPQFREGQGSMYATAQPHLAYKYGVIRNKQHIPPQMLAGGKGGLSDKSVEGLKALQALQQGQQPAPSLEQQAKDQAEGRITAQAQAAAAAGAGGVVAAGGAGGVEQLTEEDRQKVKKAIDQMDDFDWNTFKQMTMKDILNNEEQRKLIEGRLEPLSLDGLLVDGYVRQLVPIVPQRFEPMFQSIGGDEELACKRLIVADAKALDVNEQYLMDKHAFMVLTCGLHAVNGKPLPSHRDAEGNFDDKLFWQKFSRVLRYPLHMLASLSINFFWFDVRVRKLFVAETLGNG